MKTYSVKAKEIKQKWVVVDARGIPLGRLASRVATILRGKDKPIFSPHLDIGDYVIVTNSAHVKITGNRKLQDKMYYRHSMYPGGLKQRSLSDMLEKFPDRAVRIAVKGMLPRGPLGNKLLGKLKVYPEGDHPHEAQVKGSEKLVWSPTSTIVQPVETSGTQASESAQPSKPSRPRVARQPRAVGASPEGGEVTTKPRKRSAKKKEE